MMVFQFARILAPICGAHLTERHGIAGIAYMGATFMCLLASFLQFIGDRDEEEGCIRKIAKGNDKKVL